MLYIISRNTKFLFVLFFFCVLLTGIFVPLYIDEVAVKLLNARFFLDDAERFSLYPQCTNTVGLMLSWVYYPAAITLSSVFQYLEPFGIRLSGVILGLVWFGLIGYWCYRQAAENWVMRFSFLLALSSLGVFPYLWVLSRSEQLINLPILILCLLALYLPVKKNILKSLVVSTLVVFLISIFFYVHPKSLFFTPLILVLVWQITKFMHVVFRSALFVYILMLILQVFSIANLMSECNDAPIVRDLLKSYTLPIDLLVVNPLLFIELAFNNIIYLPDRMLNHLIFSDTFQSSWLPPIEISQVTMILNKFIYWTLFILVVLTHLFSICLCFFLFLKRTINVSVVLAALIAIANIANVAFYVNQSFYDGLQYVGCSILILCLFLEFKGSMVFGFLSRFFIPLVFLSIVSLLTLLYLFTPSLLYNSSYENAKIPGQNTSIPTFKVDGHLKSIKELGTACNIPNEDAVNVVVDQMTYFSYIENRRPVHILYTATDYFGADLKGDKLIPFLKGINSPGVIARCDWFPAVFDKYKINNDRGYCCVDITKIQ